MKIFIKTIFFLIFFSSPAIAWQRFEVVDDFSDEKKLIGYLKESSNLSGLSGGFLILSCDKNIKFEWDPIGNYATSFRSGHAAAPKAWAPGTDFPSLSDAANNDTILFKTEDGSVRREKWLFDRQHETLSPENLQKFLVQIKRKSQLKIKIEGSDLTGVFDITGIDRYISNIKASCKVN